MGGVGAVVFVQRRKNALIVFSESSRPEKGKSIKRMGEEERQERTVKVEKRDVPVVGKRVSLPDMRAGYLGFLVGGHAQHIHVV